jgi:hypothetical protein
MAATTAVLATPATSPRPTAACTLTLLLPAETPFPSTSCFLIRAVQSLSWRIKGSFIIRKKVVHRFPKQKGVSGMSMYRRPRSLRRSG